MKLKLISAIAFSAMAIMSCNEETLEIGTSLTNETDKLEVSTGIFTATSRSILADSVYARNFDCYFGNIKDPETGAYIKSEFMAQFNMLEDLSLPQKSQMEINADGQVVADSCEIWLFFDRDKCYGDSLTPVKISILELEKPMSDTQTYYSNYNPKGEGYIRNDGLKKNLAFTLSNLTYSDSIRNLSDYSDICRITLNNPYTDKEGKSFPNYGTYILENYYAHPDYFKNSYSFINKICPGFYFEVNDGLGVMANLEQIDMRLFYHYKNSNDSTINSYMSMSSTPEVLQTTRVINDLDALRQLVSDNSCTYLKTPAGIFTEVTLPVDEIKSAHITDSLLSVSVEFQRLNSSIKNSNYVLDAPSNLLMVMKDSLYTFFENDNKINYQTTFTTALTTTNTYYFNNIGNMITQMAKNKVKGLLSDPDWVSKHPDWNKIALVPVTYASISSYSTSSSASTTVANQMALTSTRLKGGPNGDQIELKVIYAKFNNSSK